ncbi:hypothetical protein MMC22_007418 [Lobaria immixta]|nr:hypothetical protein [Lobaria immixta]
MLAVDRGEMPKMRHAEITIHDGFLQATQSDACNYRYRLNPNKRGQNQTDTVKESTSPSNAKNGADLLLISPQDLENLGLQVNSLGLLEASRGRVLGTVPPPERRFTPATSKGSEISELTPPPQSPISQIDRETVDLAQKTMAASRAAGRRRTFKEASLSHKLDSSISQFPGFEDAEKRHRTTVEKTLAPSDSGTETNGTGKQDQGPKDATTDDIDKSSLEEDYACSCDSSVDADWLEGVNKTKFLKTKQAVGYLEDADAFLELVYWEHIEKLARGIGLKRSIAENTLMERFEIVYKNRENVWALKASEDTYSFFEDDKRPPRPAESLGAYIIKHIDPPPFDFDRTAPSELLGEGALETWDNAKTLLVDDFFGWWWTIDVPGFPEPNVGSIVEKETAMYCHYLRWAESPGQQCPEIMIHSLGQQLMRQDPAFYRAYVTLRGDLEWRLLATVIPGALPTSGDDTVFTHAEVGVSEEKVVGSMQLDVTGSMVDMTAKAVPWFVGLDNNLKIKDECFSG